MVKLYLVITPPFAQMRLPVQMTLVPIIVGSAHGPVELSSFALLAVLDICEVHDKYKYMYRK